MPSSSVKYLHFFGANFTGKFARNSCRFKGVFRLRETGDVS